MLKINKLFYKIIQFWLLGEVKIHKIMIIANDSIFKKEYYVVIYMYVQLNIHSSNNIVL